MFVHLTRPSGKLLAVNPMWVSAIERDEDRGLTKIQIGSGLYYWVTESFDDAVSKCEEARKTWDEN